MSITIQFPHATPDAQTMTLDGKRELMLSARGVVLFFLSAWIEDKNDKARESMRRYCEYIIMHGYRSGASETFTALEGMSKRKAIAWVKRTFAQYVQDERTMIQYVMAL